MRRISAAALAAACALLAPARARAGDLSLELGAGAQRSTWREPVGPTGTSRVGYRVADVVSIDLLGRLGYGAVDERLLSYFGLGASLWGALGPARPFARLLLVHQHEEPKQALLASPLEALLGVGDGIRHRAGGSLGAGLLVPFFTHERFALSAGGGADVTVMLEDRRGPRTYAGGYLSIALDYHL